MTGELAEYMAGVFAWSIDFFRLYPGDEFKVIYNENQWKEYHTELMGLVRSASKSRIYAFRYALDAEGKKMGFFNADGKEMRRPFLTSPYIQN